jgi:hypothetical protein
MPAPGAKRGRSATSSSTKPDAEELARVLGAHLENEPVGTRGFEEHEGPLRALNDADLWDALHDRMATLNDVAMAADGVPADSDVAWTGRTMKVPWMTTHSVVAVGPPCLPRAPKNYARLSSSRLG